MKCNSEMISYLSGLLFVLLHFDFNQGACNIGWKSFHNKYFLNSQFFITSTSADSCLDKCKNDTNCLAVEIVTSTNDLECRFHANPADLQVPYTGRNVTSYIKAINCSGHPGIKGVWGQTGEPNQIGPHGAPGNQGSSGFTGATGSAGQLGSTGPTGQTGSTGQTGFFGAQGLRGSMGATGQVGSMGPLIHVKEACDPSWIHLPNIQSPGSSSPNISSSNLDLCRDQCLASPSCIAVEFTASNSTCRIHANSSNLSTKNTVGGTDQWFLKQRCSLNKGSANVYSSLYGSNVNLDNLSGEVGPIGSTGATGAPGAPGAPGATGPTGNRGVTGDTGLFGLPGEKGFPGLKGATGISGDVVHVREGCQPQWISLSDVTSPGGSPGEITSDYEACRSMCLSNPICVAVDSSGSLCSLHTNLDNLSTKVHYPGMTQFFLLSRCSLKTNTSQQDQGISASLQSAKDSPPVEACKSAKAGERQKPWFYALVFTPIIALPTNILCFFIYNCAWKKQVRDRGNDAQGESSRTADRDDASEDVYHNTI